MIKKKKCINANSLRLNQNDSAKKDYMPLSQEDIEFLEYMGTDDFKREFESLSNEDIHFTVF